MAITRVKPSNWAVNEKLTSAQMNQLDTNLTYCLDKRTGQTDTLLSTVSIGVGGSIIVATGGNITVNSGTSIINNGAIANNNGSTTTYFSGSALNVNSGATATVNTGGTLNVASGGSLTTSSGSTTTLSGSVVLNNGTTTIAEGADYIFNHATRTSDAPTRSIVFNIQQPWASATTNIDVQKFRINFPTPALSGADGKFVISRSFVDYLDVTPNGGTSSTDIVSYKTLNISTFVSGLGLNISTPNNNTAFVPGGSIALTTGPCVGGLTSGNITLQCGNSQGGNTAGSIGIAAGSGTSSSSVAVGSVNISAGSFTSGVSNKVAGSVSLSAGNVTSLSANNSTGGTVTITAGDSANGTNGIGGDVRLIAGEGSSRSGNIYLLGGTFANTGSSANAIYIAEVDNAPTGAVSGGVVLYVQGGKLKIKDATGVQGFVTIT